MKQAFLLLLLLLAISCGDQSSLPVPALEGRWSQLVPDHPPTEYDFRNGLVTQSTFFAGNTVASLQFVYSQRGDTVSIGGDLNNQPRTWIIRFIGDGAMEAKQLPQTQPGLGGYFIFERL